MAANTTVLLNLLNIPGTRCPLTGDLMRDPAVLCASGLSYERAAISAHLLAHGTDPETGVVIDNHRLLPNPALKGLIDGIMASVGVEFAEEQEINGPIE